MTLTDCVHYAAHLVLGVGQRRRRGQTDELREPMVVAIFLAVKVVLGPLDLTVHCQTYHRLTTSTHSSVVLPALLPLVL